MEAPLDSAAKRLVDDVIALAPLIRESAEDMEAQRHLSEPVVAALRQAGVFRMATPRAYGGPEHEPTTQVRVVEELSAADGSVGWCAMIGVTSGFMSSRLEPASAQRLFGGADALLAGQVAPLGKAEVVDGGYRVSGRWRFGSASQHATVMMGGCIVREKGQPRRQADGQAEMRVMLFSQAACKIIDTWRTIGLRGTGSNDYTVDDLFVPFEDSFNLFEAPRLMTPLYRFPLLFLVNHAGIPLGIARSALAQVVTLAGNKVMTTRRLLREEGQVQEAVAKAEATLGAARAYAYATIDEVWQTLSRGEYLSPRQRSLFRIMMVYVHRVAKQLVAEMYDTAGTSAIFQTHPLDRHMRDILVACQHVAVQEKVYRPAGRMLLGLDPGDPFF